MATTKPKNKTDKTRKVPERRCVGCGGTFEKRDLLRIVRAPLDKMSGKMPGKVPDKMSDKMPDTVEPGVPEATTTDTPVADRISIDFSGKRSGRGAYICKKEECLAKAKKTGRLKTALECEITEEVYAQLAKEIRLEEELRGRE